MCSLPSTNVLIENTDIKVFITIKDAESVLRFVLDQLIIGII